MLVDYTNATLAVERAVNLTPRPAFTVNVPDFVDVLAFTLVCFFGRVTPTLRFLLYRVAVSNYLPNRLPEHPHLNIPNTFRWRWRDSNSRLEHILFEGITTIHYIIHKQLLFVNCFTIFTVEISPTILCFKKANPNTMFATPTATTSWWFRFWRHSLNIFHTIFSY